MVNLRGHFKLYFAVVG